MNECFSMFGFLMLNFFFKESFKTSQKSDKKMIFQQLSNKRKNYFVEKHGIGFGFKADFQNVKKNHMIIIINREITEEILKN